MRILVVEDDRGERARRPVTVGRLRRKLGDPPVIATTPGIGYRIA